MEEFYKNIRFFYRLIITTSIFTILFYLAPSQNSVYKDALLEIETHWKNEIYPSELEKEPDSQVMRYPINPYSEGRHNNLQQSTYPVSCVILQIDSFTKEKITFDNEVRILFVSSQEPQTVSDLLIRNKNPLGFSFKIGLPEFENAISKLGLSHDEVNSFDFLNGALRLSRNPYYDYFSTRQFDVLTYEVEDSIFELLSKAESTDALSQFISKEKLNNHLSLEIEIKTSVNSFVLNTITPIEFEEVSIERLSRYQCKKISETVGISNMPNVELIQDEIAEMDIGKGIRYIKKKIREAPGNRDFNLFSFRISDSIISWAIPLTLFSLFVFLYVHLRNFSKHLILTSDYKTFPIVLFYSGESARLVKILTLLVLPLIVNIIIVLPMATKTPGSLMYDELTTDSVSIMTLLGTLLLGITSLRKTKEITLLIKKGNIEKKSETFYNLDESTEANGFFP